jgi:hypothetical protein
MPQLRLFHNIPSSISHNLVIRSGEAGGQALRHFNLASGTLLKVPFEGRVQMTLTPSSGYWSVRGECLLVDGVDQELELLAPPAQCSGDVLSWWQLAMGLNNPRGEPCSGYRIGFVDVSVSLPEGAFAGDFEDLGLAAETCVANPQRGAHAAACIALVVGLRDRSGRLCVCGMAPGADAVFLSAADRSGEKLDPLVTAEAIDRLVEEDCELIVLSAGDLGASQPVLNQAILDARQAGVLVLLAAGNRPGGPLYPARDFPGQAVVPFGHSAIPPVGSVLEAAISDQNVYQSGAFFLSADMALDDTMLLAAPGIGLVLPWGDGALVLTGSSFSAPILAGVLLYNLAAAPNYLQMSGLNRSVYATSVLTEAKIWGFEPPGQRLRSPRINSVLAC